MEDETFQKENMSDKNENEQVIIEMLEKMQQQLSFLEKKLDTLVQNSQQKPSFNRERSFSRPFRPFGRPSGPGGPGGPRPNRPSGGQGFGGRPERYDRPSHGHGPSSHQGGGQGNFAPKKKSFFGGRGR